MVDEFCACGNCIQIMVQLLLLLLVIGRWLCPRSGTVTMAQKAVMLFHNFAVTSDILDLFRLLNEDKVGTNAMLVTVTLCLWTSGIIQIGIVVTERKKGRLKLEENLFIRFTGSTICGSCLENGVWAILAVLLLDDIPFLVFRFVLIIHYEVFSYTIFFFTCKNLLLTALNTNKLIAIASEHRQKVKKEKRAQYYKPVLDQMNQPTAFVKISIPATLSNVQELAVPAAQSNVQELAVPAAQSKVQELAVPAAQSNVQELAVPNDLVTALH
ncbi:transmembrane protein 26-like [Watersipora subatra]|uniref:transmembrane protein 26-like n=1 Tax=Watersipora subatra TaxID=2589382 RepID=UPI00355B338E